MTQSFDEAMREVVGFHAKGRLPEALAGYQRLLQQFPQVPELHSNVGDVLRKVGRAGEAVTACRMAIRLRPDFAEAHHNLALALVDRNAMDAAVAEHAIAARLSPQSPSILRARAQTLHRAGQLAEADLAMADLIRVRPDDADARNDRGVILFALGRIEEAVGECRTAIWLRPDFAAAHSNLGNALFDAGKLEEALTEHRKAVALAPDSADAWTNLAPSLHRLGHLEEAEAACRRAMALNPESSLPRRTLAVIRMLQDDYEQGWQEYEWRLKEESVRTYPGPRWNGEALNGRRIFVYTEQGYGDSLQFARYVPLIAERGGKIILACQPGLQSLFARLRGVSQTITFSEAVPPYDCHIPLMSCGLIFQTNAATIPLAEGYLSADPMKSDRWLERLPSLGPGKKIGICWAGNLRPDPLRSCASKALVPLARCKNVQWISLQKDISREPPLAELPLTDWTRELHDFDDTAALIANLDLVVSIDTSIAHLAGALGKPTWVMLPRVPAWRWGLARDTCPWYASARLFRAEKSGEWSDVIARIAAAVGELDS